MKPQAICAVLLGMGLVPFAIPQVSAQEKCKMAWETPAADLTHPLIPPPIEIRQAAHC
jgi:hypothetical protein